MKYFCHIAVEVFCSRHLKREQRDKIKASHLLLLCMAFGEKRRTGPRVGTPEGTLSGLGIEQLMSQHHHGLAEHRQEVIGRRLAYLL
jgi:hypothetical protein